MGRVNRRKLPRGLIESGLAMLAALAVFQSETLAGFAWRRMETATLDLRFRLRGPLPVPNDIAVVLVDDATLAELGRWPLSRHVMARAVERLDDEGAKLIVFDQLFSEPEAWLPPERAAVLGEIIAALPPDAGDAGRDLLTRFAGDDGDSDFADSIRRSGHVLLPFALLFAKPPADAAGSNADLSDAGFQQFDKSPIFPETLPPPFGVLAPIDRLREAAAGLGRVDIRYDVDSSPRYEYLAYPFNGDLQPTISVRAAAAARGVPWDQVAIGLGDHVRIGDLVVPTDPAGRLAVNYRGGRGTIPTYSFGALLRGQVPKAALDGRIVIMGASFTGNMDSNPAPFGQTELPGAERLADVIETILTQQFIQEAALTRPLEGIILLICGLIGAAIAWLPSRIMLLVASVPPVAWFVGAQIFFVAGWWVPVAVPTGALGAAAAVALPFRFWVTDREGRRIRGTFQRYVSPQLVSLLAADPSRVRLGGETRRLTILFCDVRGFTAISERFATDPQGLTRLINRFLTPMTDIILDERGTIDKYMGDCIMAFWNAPIDIADHAARACVAARRMIDALQELNETLAAEEGGSFVQLSVGIGINSGDCVVGNMGSHQRLDYSVLGDAVNLASRLEGQSKRYGVDIVVGASTRDAAPEMAWLELDRIAVKGKQEAVRIYTFVGNRGSAESPEFQALADDHEQALTAYRRQDWPEAAILCDRCRVRAPELDRLYTTLAARIEHFQNHPPRADWDGTFVADTK